MNRPTTKPVEHRQDGLTTNAGYRIALCCTCGYWTGFQVDYPTAKTAIDAHIADPKPTPRRRPPASPPDGEPPQLTLF